MGQSSPVRRRRTAEEARRQILDAAEKCLVEGGPEAIRLQEVARDVGVSHPAILHHFGSREGLLLALEARAMSRLRDDLLASEGASTPEILERVFATLGDQGHARLLAWAVQRGLVGQTASGKTEVAQSEPVVGDAENSRRDAGSADRVDAAPGDRLLWELADAWHQGRTAAAVDSGSAPPSREDTEFAVRLAATAMFGEALIGPLLTRSAGLEDNDAVRLRFRRWLGEILSR